MISFGGNMKEKIRYFIYFIVIISTELFCSQTLNSMSIGKENILMVFIDSDFYERLFLCFISFYR